ncbi:two-component system response regulator [Geomonas silvestris]|uniref:Two-component system response regulator n=1 Tax=Geomonas silvestris TaxID=2740184 RepID=A0A6V8MNP1_9BACT|nr:response regulator [Geomonas silvestris]GFO61487.1 two-component system response regulator [Geomonas silvestris]
MKCLIVDDEIFCREFVATLLRSTAECHQAGSGAEALEKFNQALVAKLPFDLVILDIMMPGMNGQEVAKRMREIEASQGAKMGHIVMLTALNSANDAMEAFCQAQSAAYLVKPVSKDGLFNMIGKLGLSG